MQTLLPQVSLDLAEPLAGTGPRRWLEIGFGGGEHLAHLAALYPDVSFIGAEAFQNGVAKLLAEIEARQLRNVRIHYGDARELLEALPDACLERIYLLYPDPWPKERHKKRRMISPETLGYFRRLLIRNGGFYFASDIPDYIDWTRGYVAAQGGFEVVKRTIAVPFENWTRTRYEAKALREGRVPAYLEFRNL
jgi:tRNA (guanine-N7-)-methyltransferase